MSLSIVTWNVNGLRACASKGFLEWLYKKQPDILCLQETRALPEQVDPELVNPKGYQSIWNSAERKGYSGTLCFFKQSPTASRSGLGKKKFDIEGRAIEMDFGDFILHNNYFPNGGRDLERVPYKLEYYKELLRKIKKWHQEGRSVIVTGDWNTCHREIDLARPKANVKNTGFLPEERAWIDKYLNENLIDTFREEYPEKDAAYTWWSNRAGARGKNIGWRLDYFLVSSTLSSRVVKNVIHDQVLGSDHCPVEMVLDF